MKVHTISKRSGRSLATLFADLVAIAKLTGVRYSEETLLRVLNAFESGFLQRSIQIRSTTKPVDRRDLCFRYLDLVSQEHPFDLAVERGELQPTDHPIFQWLTQVSERFPALGYGVDFEATRGLVKIWQFIDGAYDPEALLELPQMPAGYRASLPLLRELGLDSATIVGADYVQGSINLYFRQSRPSHATGELVSNACARLGFPAPSAAAQAHAGQAGCIAFTYGWESASVDRICFYVPGFTRDSVPAHDPLLRRFASGVPALVDEPRFILGWSHGATGSYIKIEDDYTGDVSDIFGAAMAVPKIALPDRPEWTAPHVAAAPSQRPLVR